MKKILLIVSVVFLIAAGCNKSTGNSQQKTNQSQSNNSTYIEKPPLAMTLGVYAQRKRILTAIDVYYDENKGLPNYSDLVSAGLLTNQSSDTNYLPYVQFKTVSDQQVDICLTFMADPNRPDEPQCKSYNSL